MHGLDLEGFPVLAGPGRPRCVLAPENRAIVPALVNHRASKALRSPEIERWGDDQTRGRGTVPRLLQGRITLDVRFVTFACLPVIEGHGVEHHNEQVGLGLVSPEGTANLLERCVIAVHLAKDYVARQQLGSVIQTLRDAGDGFTCAGDDALGCDDCEATIVLGHHDVLVSGEVVQRWVLFLERSALLAQCLGC